MEVGRVIGKFGEGNRSIADVRSADDIGVHDFSEEGAVVESVFVRERLMFFGVGGRSGDVIESGDGIGRNWGWSLMHLWHLRHRFYNPKKQQERKTVVERVVRRRKSKFVPTDEVWERPEVIRRNSCGRGESHLV